MWTKDFLFKSFFTRSLLLFYIKRLGKRKLIFLQAINTAHANIQ